MLDMKLFRDNPEVIRRDHERRGISQEPIDEVIRLDKEWKNSLHTMEASRRKRNIAAKEIAEAKKQGDQNKVNAILSQVKDLGLQIEQLDARAKDLLLQRDNLRMSIPNILHDDVPSGDDEQGNTMKMLSGEKPDFSFTPKTHNELIELNKWVDLERGAKVTGSRFFFLKGDLARMEIALQQFSIDHLTSRGFTLVQPPVMMNRDAYEGVTDLSDFETVMYGVEPDKLYMIATSEHPLTAMFKDEVIEPSKLPINMVGVSPCFRREVGAHGLSDRGIWRVHQFTKVEQIIICHPDDSWNHHEVLLENCRTLWDALEIHYQIVNICTGDMGTVAAKKYDLEAWLPGANAYKEIVSCSNCTDYQANR
ncbi:MAG TPA: serine--tRNA ligase, partial [Candidatus Poseidoniaceae archaeon]|nr:serine--tRNA ligase [Candidatus Poseidoniaceae archaeon]